MVRTLLAALLLAAPAFAQDYGYGQYNGDDSWSQVDNDAPPPPEQGPSVDDFRNDSELSWNGNWVLTPEYGWVWQPTRVDTSWQPYLYGRWAWTDAGWAWVSEEPFGWAVYHYGRWGYAPAMGWYWVPGSEWAPAWVAWRWGDRYAGWCALGPQGGYVPQRRWVWVDTPHFMDPVRHHVVPQPRNIGNPTPTVGPHAGPAVAAVERAIGRTVRPMPVRDAPTPQAAQAGSSNPMFYRPRAVAPSGPRVREERPRGYYDSTRNTPYARPAPAPAAGQNSGPRPAAAPSAAPAPAQPHATAPHATAPHAAPPSNAQQPKTQER